MPKTFFSLALGLTLLTVRLASAQAPSTAASSLLMQLEPARATIVATHIYAADVLAVLDGDSLRVRVDLGLETERRLDVRVYGLFAPEKRTDEGKAVTAAAIRLLYEHGGRVLLQPRILASGKPDKSFARYVCDVWFEDDGQRYADALRARVTWTDNGIGGAGKP